MMKTEFILNTLDELIEEVKCPLNYKKDYELLLAVMLSAQTTDLRVNEVTKTLFQYDLESLKNMDVEKIEEIIKPVGTQKRKAKYVKEIARILIDETGGIVPNDRKFVESLPGVGHKTCNVVFSEIFHEDAIAVDTHVLRVCKRLGITNIDDDVIKTEQKLMEIFPKESWRKLHIELVLFGRHTCKSKKPLCSNCPFRNAGCVYEKKV